MTTRTLLEALESSQFDLKSRMGDVLLELVALDSVDKIRDTTRALFQIGSLDAQLKDSRLWILAQQRHLIVHRRGIVDARYVERTGDQQPIGQALRFDADYLERCMVLVRDLGCEMHQASREVLAATAHLTTDEA